MPGTTLRKALGIFGNIFMQPYGLTEAGLTVTNLGKEEHNIWDLSDTEANKKLRSCGRPFFGRFVKVVDEEGEELIHFCKQSLASYKKPRSVEFVSDLPRNPQGKILKNVLREKFWTNRERKV